MSEEEIDRLLMELLMSSAVKIQACPECIIDAEDYDQVVEILIQPLNTKNGEKYGYDS